MSNSDIRVVPGPANYFSHPGSLERLSDFFSADQLASGVGLWRARPGRRRTFLPAAFHLPEAKRSSLPATAANATWRGWCRPPVTIGR